MEVNRHTLSVSGVIKINCKKKLFKVILTTLSERNFFINHERADKIYCVFVFLSNDKIYPHIFYISTR